MRTQRLVSVLLSFLLALAGGGVSGRATAVFVSDGGKTVAVAETGALAIVPARLSAQERTAQKGRAERQRGAHVVFAPLWVSSAFLSLFVCAVLALRGFSSRFFNRFLRHILLLQTVL